MRKSMGILGLGLALVTNTLQGATTTNLIKEEVGLEGQYIDISTYNFNYIHIPGFLVAPLQVEGELLACFSQERSGYVHEGIDIRATEGTPIFAIADGIVTKAAPDSKGVEKGGGHMIFIDFGEGVEGRYMHLNTYAVKTGDLVKQGQVIGFTGNTGDSTTPHLHFEYRVDGVPLNPAFIFEASGIIEGQALNDINNTLASSKDAYNSYLLEDSFYVVQQ